MSTSEPELGSRTETLHRRKPEAGMHPLRRLNPAAVALITHDVVTATDQAMTRLTSCVGWTVADLIRHINDEYEATNHTVLSPLEHRSDDPRDDFAAIADRWIHALAQAGPTHLVSARGETERVKNVRANPHVKLTKSGMTDYVATEIIPAEAKKSILEAYKAAANKATARLFRQLPQDADHPVFALTLN